MIQPIDIAHSLVVKAEAGVLTVRPSAVFTQTY